MPAATNKRWRRVFIFPLALLASAQSPSPPVGEKPPTFAVATQRIRVDVVVHDKDGKPVADLTAADFQLFEDGREQAIESFSVEGTPAAPGPASTPAAPATAGRVDFDNRPGGRAPSATVILLDRLNTRFEDQQQARTQIVKFLSQIQPDDRVGLYSLESGSVRVLHDFTTDAAALLRALARHEAGQSRELDASEATAPTTGDPDMDAFLAAAFRETRGAGYEDRLSQTMSALTAIAGHLAGVRGRKNLVWVSAAFPMINGVTSTEARIAGRALTAADVAIYPVDVRGLIGPILPNASATRPTSRDAAAAAHTGFATMDMTLANVDTMRALADETGGLVFYDTNAIGTAIRRAVDDARVTYVLGYAPLHGKWDGAFHEIKVKVRRSGLEVRHRKGYRAYAAPPAPTGAQREAALFQVIRSPLEAMGMGLQARVDARAKAGEPLSLAIRLDPGSVTVRKNGAEWQGSFDIAIVQRLPEDKLFKSLDTTVELRLTDELHERMLRDGIVVNRKVPLRDDADRLHIVVRDTSTGALGSLSIPASALRDAGGR